MAIRASDLPHAVQAALAKQLARENGEPPAKPTVLWLARVPLLKIKPIKSHDPIFFLQLIERLQERYPTLTIYIFQIDGVNT